MKCPNCGKKILKDAAHQFCIHCGYLDDGKQIHTRDEKRRLSDLEIYLGDDFDKIYRNDTSLACFLLGPFYFCYRHYLLLGVLSFLGEILFWRFWLWCFPRYSFLSFIFAFFMSRVFFMTVSNMIYLRLCERKIKRIKKKYGDNYLDELRKFNGKSGSILSVILGIGVFFLSIFFALLYVLNKNGLI